DQTRALARRLRDLPWLEPALPSIEKFSDELLLAWIEAIDDMRVDLIRKLELLRMLLACRREPVVQAVFAVLGRHYSPSVRPALIELAESPIETIRFHALAALSQARFEGRDMLMQKN